MARYSRPLDYIFNSSNDDVIENIHSIFNILSEKTVLINGLSHIFNEDIRMDLAHKKYRYVSQVLYQFYSTGYGHLYEIYKPIIEDHGVRFLPLKTIIEYLYEN